MQSNTIIKLILIAVIIGALMPESEATFFKGVLFAKTVGKSALLVNSKGVVVAKSLRHHSWKPTRHVVSKTVLVQSRPVHHEWVAARPVQMVQAHPVQWVESHPVKEIAQHAVKA